MGYVDKTVSRMRPVELSHEDAFHYDRLAHTLLEEALFEHDQFVHQDRRHVNPANWKLYKQDDDVVVYRERHSSASASAPSLLDDREPTTTTAARFTAFQAAPSESKYHTPAAQTPKMPRLLAIGSLATTLDDVLYGIVTSSASAMRLKASYLQNDEFVDGTVLAQIRTPTTSDPFQFLGIKWLLQRGTSGGLGLGLGGLMVRPRDFVFLESSGVQIRQDGTGQRVGFHIMHSVELSPEFSQPPSRNRRTKKGTGASARVQRGAFSTCSLYHERADGHGVDVYMTALVEPRGNLIAPMATRSALAMLRTNWKSLSLCTENKKLAYLLQTHQQLHHHETLLPPAAASASRPSNNGPPFAHRCGLCSKSLKGFTTKKRTCQLCQMTVCTACSMARTLKSEALANNKIVSSEMVFCKKCISHASDESASEIASQQVWEQEVVRTGRAQTQTMLALRRETNASRRLLMLPASSGTGSGYDNHQSMDMRRTWHDTDPGARYMPLMDDRHTASGSSGRPVHMGMGMGMDMRGSVPTVAAQKMGAATGAGGAPGSRRTINGTWNGSTRTTDSLSIGTIGSRNSVLYTTEHSTTSDGRHRGLSSNRGSSSTVLHHIQQQGDQYSSHYYNGGGGGGGGDGEGGERISSVSSAMVLLDDSRSSSRMKALDYLPHGGELKSQTPTTTTAWSSSAQDQYEVESVYSSRASLSSSIAVMDLDASQSHQRQSFFNDHHTNTHVAAIAEHGEDVDGFSQPPQAARYSTHRQQYHQQQQQQPLRTSTSTRPSLVEPRPSEILLPSRSNSIAGASESGETGRLSYQMQLWMQMNELRDTAESTYQTTKKNSEAMHSMRFFAQQPLGRGAPTTATATRVMRTQTQTQMPPPPLPPVSRGYSHSISTPRRHSSTMMHQPMSR